MAVLDAVAKRLPEQIKIWFEDWHDKSFHHKGYKVKRLTFGLVSFVTLVHSVFSKGLTYGISCAPSGRKDQTVMIPVPFI